AVVEGAKTVEGLDLHLRSIEELTADDLLEYDAIIMGSPVYFGTMAAEVKQLIDVSVKHFTELDGKLGGAFASSGAAHGGNETTILDICKALMVHGMIVRGIAEGSHYGPVAVGEPDDEECEECREYGRTMGQLAVKLFG
ncbi:MAG: flavodoxin family protein, partial [Armatimonadota bacterium]